MPVCTVHVHATEAVTSVSTIRALPGLQPPPHPARPITLYVTLLAHVRRQYISYWLCMVPMSGTIKFPKLDPKLG